MLSKGSGQGGRDGYVRWVGRVVRLLRTPFALTAKSTNPTYYLEPPPRTATGRPEHTLGCIEYASTCALMSEHPSMKIRSFSRLV